MSLRQYLFCLIGGLIVLLTLVQIIFIYWLQNNIEQDVQTKVRSINEQAFQLALDQVLIAAVSDKAQDSTSPAKRVRAVQMRIDPSTLKQNEHQQDLIIEVEQIGEAVDKSLNNTANIEVYAIDQTRQVVETEHQKQLRHVPAERLKQAFEHQIEFLLKERTPPATSSTALHTKDNNNIRIHRINTRVNDTNIEDLLLRIQLIILFGGLIALTLAYWLSITFNRPLKMLVRGFEQLATGNYQHRVAAVGVKEMKTTIAQFNQMAAQLTSLSKAEKHHKEIAHLAELGEVSRGLAHALRSPIHTIGLSLEQLSESQLNNKQRQALLAQIQRKINHIDNNIKSLLTLTTTGIIRAERCPILAIVQDIILEYKTVQAKPVTFKLNIAENMHLTGAESEIRSILHTLINNACEVSEQDGEIVISAEECAEHILFKVADNGTGIAPNIAPKLFSPHVSTKPDGAGMGLYIAQRIISLHYHGKITLKNQCENGNITGCIALACFSKLGKYTP